MTDKIMNLVTKIQEFAEELKLNLVVSDELNIFKNKCIEKFSSDLSKIIINKKTQNIIIDEILKRIFNMNYTFNKFISFDNGINSFRELDNLISCKDIKVPKEFKELEKQYNYLKNTPQPIQRSTEWFNYRRCRITASDTAAAIDMNPYEPIESFILKKCDPEFPFQDNQTVFHGRKYEPVATLIYEHIYNSRVDEFGVLPSDKYPFLGASPDGICSKYTLDNKFSNRLGTMLEIKCPVTREIKIDGRPKGDICPYYYYCQVQQQLICCNLNVCDFWQCKLIEYKSRKEYLNDNCEKCIITESNNYESDNDIIDYKTLNVCNKIKKGIILEFYPIKFSPEFENDKIEWKSKYIVPSRLDMNQEQYDEWVIQSLENYKNPIYKLNENYYFNKIIYWKLNYAHNLPIKINMNFLNYVIPILENTWNHIKYYREHIDELDKLRIIAEKRKKYMKINTSYTIHNNYIMKNKALFLEDNFNIYVFLNNLFNNSQNNSQNNIDCEFIDN
jgi:putative phage-type endonuclease